LKNGLNLPKKIVKIDLDQMSSGSEVSSSESSSSDQSDEIGQEMNTNFSQHDSEINKIKINPESVLNETQTVKTSKLPFI
jgi:type I site-specific restriction endonuclease